MHVIISLRLVPRAEKMNLICVVIGYPSGQDGATLPAWDCPLCLAWKMVACMPYAIFYWRSLFGKGGWILASIFSCAFMDLNWVPEHEHAEKIILANIQPTWLHSWSITHIYIFHTLSLVLRQISFCLFSEINVVFVHIMLRIAKHKLRAINSITTIIHGKKDLPDNNCKKERHTWSSCHNRYHCHQDGSTVDHPARERPWLTIL